MMYSLLPEDMISEFSSSVQNFKLKSARLLNNKIKFWREFSLPPFTFLKVCNISPENPSM